MNTKGKFSLTLKGEIFHLLHLFNENEYIRVNLCRHPFLLLVTEKEKIIVKQSLVDLNIYILKIYGSYYS
jgi:hypothetical protein